MKKSHRHRIERAKTLLEEEGWIAGPDGIKERDGGGLADAPSGIFFAPATDQGSRAHFRSDLQLFAQLHRYVEAFLSQFYVEEENRELETKTGQHGGAFL